MMNYRSFLIKYSEIAIKGANRHVFEDALVKQIRNVLRKVQGRFNVIKTVGRIYVEVTSETFDYDETLSALQHVFGITKICPVVRVPDLGFPDLCEQVRRFIDEVYPEKDFTFKVDARRTRKNYPLASMEINAELGAYLLDAFPELRVDVHEPDVLLRVEVRDKDISIYSYEIPGPGGMPLGTAGRAMLLLSGGIDSPVAGYMVSKRGVFVEAVYFHAPPYTSDRAKQKVVDLAKEIAPYTGPIRLHVINFTDIQLAIYERCPHEELTIIMRRYMMMIAEKLAVENDCQCLVTGESIGQVASQTMFSLAVTNEICTLPVFRPLIAFDKQDIVDIALKLGTYETSILPYEDCCTIFVAKHPVTHPVLEKIRESEKALAPVIDELLAAAFASDEVITCEADHF